MRDHVPNASRIDTCTAHTGDFRIISPNPKVIDAVGLRHGNQVIVERPVYTDIRTYFCESDLSSLPAFVSYGDIHDHILVALTLESQDLGDMRLI